MKSWIFSKLCYEQIVKNSFSIHKELLKINSTADNNISNKMELQDRSRLSMDCGVFLSKFVLFGFNTIVCVSGNFRLRLNAILFPA